MISLHEAALRLRKAAPGHIRHLFRLSRHIVPNGRRSPHLPPELVEECRMCASRFDLIKKLPKGGRIAEVGTDTGRFALHILAEAAPTEIHLIDLDFSRADEGLRQRAGIVFHQGRSEEILASFEDASFDWIYIDADHSYEGCKRDAAAAATKVKPGGYLVFNDFAHADPFLGTYGVHRAVTEFALARRWPLAWLAYNPSALYDVALRNPGLAE